MAKMYGKICNCKQAIHEVLLGDVLPALVDSDIQSCTMLCSQVGLGVAAAVACCIKETQGAGTGDAACLPSTKDVLANTNDLKQAEQCIAKIQYNPFSPRYV